jgi:hypothetical protein
VSDLVDALRAGLAGRADPAKAAAITENDNLHLVAGDQPH